MNLFPHLRSFAILVFALMTVLSSALHLNAEQQSSPLLLKEGLDLFEPEEDVAPSGLDVVEAYEEAKRLEAEIVEMFREMRAADLSMVQRQTLARSLEATLVPLSDRAEINTGLLRRKVNNAEDIQEYQAELAVVMQETDAIVANAQELLEIYLEEQTSSSEASAERRRQEEEEMASAEMEAAREASETQAEREAREVREATERVERERLTQQAEEELKETELNLEQAQKEIQAAKQLAEKETSQLEKEIAQKKGKTTEKKEAKESTEPEASQAAEQTAARQESQKAKKQQTASAEQAAKKETNLEEWKELKEKVETAETAVKEVLEETKNIGEASEEKLARAEEAMESMQEALASAMSADSAASELAESQESGETESSAETDQNASERESSAKKAKDHTRNAVSRIESAKNSLDSASSALAALKEKSGGGGGGSGTNNGVAMRQAMGRLAQARSGKWLDVTNQMRGNNLNAQPTEVGSSGRPPLWNSREELETAPSIRKVMADSRPGDDWYFIGDWYVLSRYNNEGRENLQKVYPPESVLDLNAHYVSEDARPMQWEYESYAPPMVVPYGWESWKIYYFYTELYVEQETEAWIAIGSDDRSDLWINDLPVWHSANRHKGWTPDEGFRKVVFQPGHNKLLLRLENGHQGLGFSLYLNFSDR